MTAPKPDDILRVEHIAKRYGAVTALVDVNLRLEQGEVLGLIGDNGAGKSTLVKVISGIHPSDEGGYEWQGQPVKVNAPQDATHPGIATVYQDLALCDNLDVVENLYLGREAVAGGLLDEVTMEHKANELLAELSVTTIQSVRGEVGAMSGGQRQGIAIARAIAWADKVVILDEPTAALGVVQTKNVLESGKRVRDKGIAVVFISHSMPHVLEICDRIQVLRLGKRVATYRGTDTSVETLVGAMTGALDGRAA